ncbi:MAG: hypothetical protein ACOY82_13855 [Pseudomonadota bacterium]
MDTSIVTSLISGAFAMGAALGSVWLKHRLERPQKPSGNARFEGGEKVGENSGKKWFFPRLLLIVSLSFLTGFLLQRYRESWATFLFFAAVLFSFIGLVRAGLGSRSGFWLYQLDAIMLWGAFESGYIFSRGRVWSDALFTSIVFWIGFAVLGGGIILIARLRRSSGDPR